MFYSAAVARETGAGRSAVEKGSDAVQTTLGHVQFNVRPEHMPFYSDLAAFLELPTIHADAGVLGVQLIGSGSVWFIGQVNDATNDYDGPGLNHFAFGAASQADVDATAAFLKERNVERLFGTPTHRPDFAMSDDQTYYQVMFESPDRILFEVVYIGPKQS